MRGGGGCSGWRESRKNKRWRCVGVLDMEIIVEACIERYPPVVARRGSCSEASEVFVRMWRCAKCLDRRLAVAFAVAMAVVTVAGCRFEK